MTDLKQMALVMQLNDLTQRLLDAHEAQNKALEGLLEALNDYMDWCNETVNLLKGEQ